MIRRPGVSLAIIVMLALPSRGSAQAQDSVRVRDDSVMVRFSATDIRAAVQALGRYLDKPVLTGSLPSTTIAFFETPTPVPRAQLPTLLQGLVEAQGLVFVEEPAFYRISTAPPTPPGAAPGRQQAGEPQEPIHLYVIRLKHARAADVAATVNQLFGTGGSFAGSQGFRAGTLSEELRRDAAQTLEAPGTPAQQEGEASLQGPVVMVPDELTNSLLVRATEADYDVLLEAVEQLDVRPLQVLVEILIVEARKDRRFAFGLGLEVPPQSVEGGGTIGGEMPVAGLGDLVVQVMSLGKYEINAIITAARRRGDVRIVSRPVILASNNTEARLLVGSQRPFVQVSRAVPTETPNRDQVVQYRDVGTKLTVRPTVNQDGYVSLMIQQEISQATEEVQFDAPVISTRETTTQVLVGDGQTIVLGGITDTQRDHVRTGVPILVDIPIIGGVFGSTSTRTTETELFLFITPTILRDDADAARVTAPRLPADADGVGEIDAQPDSTSAGGGRSRPDSTSSLPHARGHGQ
jgi:type II secretory pathway component GspD/PulD (secretin)